MKLNSNQGRRNVLQKQQFMLKMISLKTEYKKEVTSGWQSLELPHTPLVEAIHILQEFFKEL